MKTIQKNDLFVDTLAEYGMHPIMLYPLPKDYGLIKLLRETVAKLNEKERVFQRILGTIFVIGPGDIKEFKKAFSIPGQLNILPEKVYEHLEIDIKNSGSNQFIVDEYLRFSWEEEIKKNHNHFVTVDKEYALRVAFSPEKAISELNDKINQGIVKLIGYLNENQEQTREEFVERALQAFNETYVTEN